MDEETQFHEAKDTAVWFFSIIFFTQVLAEGPSKESKQCCMVSKCIIIIVFFTFKYRI